MRWLPIFFFIASASALTSACGGAPAKPSPNVKETKIEPPPDQPSSIITVKEEPKPDAYRAPENGLDAPVPYVRDERSSRLDAALPKGKAKESWRAPLALGDAPALKAAFVLAVGNRAAVIGNEAWVTFDTKGLRIAGHDLEGPAARMDRASGLVVPDELRSGDLPKDSKLASQKGLVVLVKNGGVYVGEKAIEGKFEALDVAIDDKGIACVMVTQGDELAMWTVPIANSTTIGRHKIGKQKHSVGPPVLGKSTRVLVLDTGIVAYAIDGKKLWEQKGLPTGGVSITSDDQVLIADGNKVVAVDHRGKKTVLWSGPDVTFVTPPILTGEGLMLVASTTSLHAFAF